MAATARPGSDDEDGGCIYEAPPDGAPADAVDCADEFLPEGERFDDAERVERRRDPFADDWSAVRAAGAARE